jgi:hypothetical protein
MLMELNITKTNAGNEVYATAGCVGQLGHRENNFRQGFKIDREQTQIWKSALNRGSFRMRNEDRNAIIYGDHETSTVWIGDKVLDIRRSLKFENKSSSYSWGYHGSGPSQLALAIMLELCDDDENARRLFQEFKISFIADEPSDKDLMIPVAVVTQWIEEHLTGGIQYDMA